MCGIAGIVSSSGSAPARLATMLKALVHRGPDDEGSHVTAGAAIGQRRLSIIDLEGGHQPIPNEDRSSWIVCNGEIYNYQALRKDLQQLGHRFSTKSDSEVVLHLYEEYGDACVDHLRGMFAFAIWDEKAKRLFAARDRLGQKPFYYVHKNAELCFASEIKSLLAQDDSLRKLNRHALDQYLNLRIIAPPLSMFDGIAKLPPAHTLSFSERDGLEIRRYWNLSFVPKHEGSDEQLTDELEARLIDALRLHMVSDVPVGAFMSGGLDSTLLVAMLMKHVANEPIQTFSMGLPYKDFDEAPYARQVAEKYGTLHHEKIVTPSLVDTLPQLLWHLDEPSDPLSVCTYLIARLARQHVKVVIGGDGGDELFGGYDRYYGNKYAGLYAQVPAAVRKYAVGPLLKLLPSGSWYKSKAHQVRWLHELSFHEEAHRYVHSLSYFYFGAQWRNRLYGPEMLGMAQAFDAGAAIRDPYNAAQATDPIDRMLYADTCVRLPDHPVMITDRMTMSHSLEARAPFMDHELAEFAAQLPMRMKVRGRSLRYIQYRLAERYLPPDLLTRPKQGFSSALPYMLRDEYKKLYTLFLRDAGLARAGLLSQKGINQVLAEHEAGKADHGNRLWLLVNSEAWYRMFIGGQSADEMAGFIQAG